MAHIDLEKAVKLFIYYKSYHANLCKTGAKVLIPSKCFHVQSTAK